MPHVFNRLRVSSLRAAARLKDVLAVLAKYGFEEVLDKAGFHHTIPFRSGAGPYHDMGLWRKLRYAVEDLGPTAIKIGQAASMRPDLIPPELALELKDLHEDVAEVEFSAIRASVEAALGQPLEAAFAWFEPQATAAASLSQVHRAALRDTGDIVAVKVRRPGIEAVILADLDLLAYLSGIIHERIESLRPARLPELVAELRKSLVRELDFLNEAQNMTIFRANFADEPGVFAPRAHLPLCRRNLLVMEFVEGSRIDRLELDDDRRRRLADMGLAAATRMMLEHGFFHADPHFGNLRVTADDRLCFLDWGMVGRLTPEMRSALVDYILALVNRDVALLARVALDMSVAVPPLLDVQKFQTDCMFVLERILAPVDGQANLGRFLLELTELCRGYGVHLRSDYVLMARALMSIEAAGRTIFPQFDVMAAFRPIAARYLLRRASVVFSDKPVLGEAAEGFDSLRRLPARLHRLLGVMETGAFSSQIQVRDFGVFVLALRKAANRLAEAIVIASLVLGSSIIYRADFGPHWLDMPVIGLLGYGLSLALGLILLWQIMFGRDA